MTINTAPHRVDKSKTTPVEEFKIVWIDFNQALRDVYADFDHWYWLRSLLISGAKCLLHPIRGYTGHVSQIVPCFAITLVFMISLCYFLSIHHPIIVKRWCNCDFKDESTQEDCMSVVNGKQPCLWSIFHASVVIYLTTMILWNYVLTVFASPGLALPSQSNDTSKMIRTIVKTSVVNEPTSSPFRWRSVGKTGGCCYLKSNLNIEKEHRFVALYDGGIEEDWASTEGIVYIPSPQKSYCKKCQMNRPPRCHHCSSCNRCVLQMDHHCLWMNNCIGYNNYRSFVLTLVYLVLGCCYGISILAVPFYETIKDQIHQHGLHLLYKNKTGFLDLPMPWHILYEIWETGTINLVTAVKIIFPILATAGVCVIFLLLSHMKFISKAVTTLEYTATMHILKTDTLRQLRERRNQNERLSEKKVRVVNPFDQGISSNLQQVFGPKILHAFLPIIVMPPKPYVPNCKGK